MVEVKKIDKDLEFLRQVSQDVNIEKDDVKEYIQILEEYSLSHGVFAMAAVQLGIPKRIMYIKNTRLDMIDNEDWNEATVMINPVIKSMKGLTEYWEACASCMDNTGLVLRPYKIEVDYLTLEGNKESCILEGFPATVFSHEYDHLDGILHMDKAIDLKIMNKEERKEFRKTHDYEIHERDGDFLELEKVWQKKLKQTQ